MATLLGLTCREWRHKEGTSDEAVNRGHGVLGRQPKQTWSNHVRKPYVHTMPEHCTTSHSSDRYFGWACVGNGVLGECSREEFGMALRERDQHQGAGNGRYFAAFLGARRARVCVETYSSRDVPGQCDGIITLVISHQHPRPDLTLKTVERFPESGRREWTKNRCGAFTDNGWVPSGEQPVEVLTQATPDD